VREITGLKEAKEVAATKSKKAVPSEKMIKKAELRVSQPCVPGEAVALKTKAM
jgi:hypothetical protein